MDYCYYDELYHYGVKGMKWGVRRYQNSDGSLTSAGKKRYSDESKRFDKEAEEARVDKQTGLSDKQKKAIKLGIAAVAVGLTAYGSYKVGTSVEFHNFVNELKYKNVEFDEVTHLPLKNKTLSNSDEILKDLKTINKGFLIKPGTTQNCMHCTTAYDLRRRGLEVKAATTKRGHPAMDIKKWYKGVELKKLMPSDTDEDTYKNLCSTLLSHGNGARGNLIGFYKHSPSAGHSIIWEVINNDVVFMDAQIGKRYSNGFDAVKYFDKDAIRYARLDNLEINTSEVRRIINY